MRFFVTSDAPNASTPRRKRTTPLLFAVASLLAFLIILPGFAPALGATATTVDREELRGELAVKKAALSRARAELNALQAELDQLAEEHNAIEVRLAELEEEIREVEKEIAQSEEDLDAVQVRLEERLVGLYKQRSSSVSIYVDVLLSEKDLASVLQRLDTLNEIAEEDQKLFDEVMGYLEASWAAKEVLERKQAEQAANLEKLVQVEEKAAKELASAEGKYQGLKSQISKLKAEIAAADRAAAEAERKRRQEEIRRRAAQAGSRWNNSSNGTIHPPPFIFPVKGAHSFRDTWGAPRSGGRVHVGCDVMAAEGTPLVACVTGYISGLNPSDSGLGGISIYLRGNNGYSYYYCHLERIASGIQRGTPVKAGQVIGYVGHTGNAARTLPHLHFGMRPGGGKYVNPYATLKYYDQ
jgi:murein DD-endopeptidase MepM/ murein hydrolase activator NlpD